MGAEKCGFGSEERQAGRGVSNRRAKRRLRSGGKCHGPRDPFVSFLVTVVAEVNWSDERLAG